MSIKIVFEAEFGCFTRPEFAAERVSYEIPPPTAARGMLESILWKPEISYRICSVAILKPTKYFRLTLNEVSRLAPCNVVEQRSQKRCMILRDPAFLIEAEIIPGARAITKEGHNLQTYYEMFLRRLQRGQCVDTPCMGQRDFPATFRLPTEQDQPLGESRPLGPMTYIVWNRNNYPLGAERRRETVSALMFDGVVSMQGWQQ